MHCSFSRNIQLSSTKKSNPRNVAKEEDEEKQPCSSISLLIKNAVDIYKNERFVLIFNTLKASKLKSERVEVVLFCIKLLT